MTPVVFATPFLGFNTMRFLRAVAALPDVKVGLVTASPADAIPADLRPSIAAHYGIKDGMDPQQIADATRWLSGQLGGCERLLGMYEQLQVPLGEVRDALGIEGMGAEAAKNFRDKARMKDVLRAAGLPCARHRLVASADAAAGFGREVGYPLIIKPPAGAGSVATHRVADEGELRAAIGSMKVGPGNLALCEEFMQGLERSFEVVSVGGVPVWHSLTMYDPPPIDVVRNRWIQWTVCLPREVEDPAFDDVRGAGFAALKALGMGTGLSHMEWFRRPDGTLAISEIAARPPGAQIMRLMSFAGEVDMYARWARLMVSDAFAAPERKYAVGAAFLRGQGEGRVVALRGLEAAQDKVAGLVVEAHLPRLGMWPSGSYEGEGYVIVRHEETEVVQRALRDIVGHVRVDLG